MIRISADVRGAQRELETTRGLQKRPDLRPIGQDQIDGVRKIVQRAVGQLRIGREVLLQLSCINGGHAGVDNEVPKATGKEAPGSCGKSA